MKSNIFKMGLTLALAFFFSITEVNAQPNTDNKQERKQPSVDEIFEQMDADENGKLSLEEIKGPLKKDFTTIDEDEDGFITKEELEKAPKPKRKRPNRWN